MRNHNLTYSLHTTHEYTYIHQQCQQATVTEIQNKSKTNWFAYKRTGHLLPTSWNFFDEHIYEIYTFDVSTSPWINLNGVRCEAKTWEDESYAHNDEYKSFTPAHESVVQFECDNVPYKPEVQVSYKPWICLFSSWSFSVSECWNGVRSCCHHSSLRRSLRAQDNQWPAYFFVKSFTQLSEEQ
jgi:hypothetical protein